MPGYKNSKLSYKFTGLLWKIDALLDQRGALQFAVAGSLPVIQSEAHQGTPTAFWRIRAGKACRTGYLYPTWVVGVMGIAKPSPCLEKVRCPESTSETFDSYLGIGKLRLSIYLHHKRRAFVLTS